MVRERSLPESRFKDSEKVLTEIQEIIGLHEAEVTLDTGSPSLTGEEFGQIALSTLKRIGEVLNDNPKTLIISKRVTRPS